MNKASRWHVQIALCAALALVLSACAAPSPKDFGGHWHPVNRFSATATPIPLRQSYEYFASPLDRTLKDMLDRWAKDTHTRVIYYPSDDFTLPESAAAIHTHDVSTAVSQLNGIYRAQDITIAIQGGAFVVTGVAPVRPASTTRVGRGTAVITPAFTSQPAASTAGGASTSGKR